MDDTPFAPLRAALKKPGGERAERGAGAWSIVAPVPADAPAPPKRHPKLGLATAVWIYRDGRNRTLGFQCRFDAKDGKQFRPLTLRRAFAAGAMEWRWESWPEPRPLYGLDRLAARADAQVLICEGEKAADAAARLAPAFVAIASPHGAKSAGKAAWSPLRGRAVTIWPDADAPGARYADEVARLCTASGAASVAIVAPPTGMREGWDAADAEHEKWTPARALKLVNSARLFAGANANILASIDGDGEETKPARPRPRPSREALAALGEKCEFWRDAEGKAYATFPVGAHRENALVRSERFADWLTGRAYRAQGLVPGAQALEDMLRLFRARAVEDGREYKPALRVGAHGERWYIDLCDADRRVIEVGPHEWAIRESCPVKFIRTSSMLPLPVPEEGLIEGLRPFLNVETDADFVLVTAWLVAALCPCEQYPILIVQGEQGAGKTTFTRLVRRLVDPNVSPVRSPPKEEADVMSAAKSAHLQAFDNLSKIDANMANIFCRMSTGGGFSARKKYSDSDEHLVQVCNPIILNGIPALATRPDLARRSVVVQLKTIGDHERRAEEDFWLAFKRVEAGILGALCDALSTALRRLPEVTLSGAPSMASFFKLISAASPGLGWEPEEFAGAYAANRAEIEGEAFANDPFVGAVARFIFEDYPQGWAGTATELLERISPKAPEGVKRSRAWPQGAQGLGNALRRVLPVLRARGIRGEFSKRGGERVIVFSALPGPPQTKYAEDAP